MKLNSTRKSSWLVPLGNHDSVAQLNLFCIPPAGSGALFYRLWPALLPDWINLWGVRLPGRETRIQETLLTQWDVVTEQLTQAIYPYCRAPYAIFGHSLGALIGFEVTHQIHALYGHSPEVLIVSGHPAPHLVRDTKEHYETDGELQQKLRTYGGTPEIILNDPEWMAAILPIFRADLQLRNNYIYQVREPFNCPILALAGIADTTVSPEGMFEWESYTQTLFDLKIFDGNHMYLTEEKQRSSVIQTIIRLFKNNK